jgi:Icc protein
MLTIAQITDLHITTAKDPINQKRNEDRLRIALSAIHALRPRPVAILATGDLVDRGEPEEFDELARILADCDIPIYLGVGNHDARAGLLSRFGAPQVRTDDHGFVQYTLDFDDLRVVMADTLQEGAAGGAFCAKRAKWLKSTLQRARRRPTVVALHHPPISSGVQWMDPAPDEPWIIRLTKTLRSQPQVRAVICGHLHRPFHASFAGAIVSVSPATSIQLTLDLTPIDMRTPDGREILTEEPVAFSLLMWDRGVLTIHTCQAGPFAPAVHYTVPFIQS